LLSRIVQAWQEIHRINGIPISERASWGTIYSLSPGLNYGAFSIAVSASLTGVMWRTVMKKEHLSVTVGEFARVNLPIIVAAMMIACSILVGQVYLVRGDRPYDS
jgi:Na+/H+ antiporter NhaD/arsenite permease-like protein